MKSHSNKKLIVLLLQLCILIISFIQADSVRLSSKSEMNLGTGLGSQVQASSRAKLVVLNGILAKDIGAGIMDSTWVCGLDGRVYRYDPVNVNHNVLNNPPNCIRVDIDYEALPWLITTSHQVWRMVHEFDSNFRWLRLDGKLLINNIINNKNLLFLINFSIFINRLWN